MSRDAFARGDFPLLARTVNGRPLVYLDNAATLPMPRLVLDELCAFRSNSYANIHRGVHTLSEESSRRYDEARRTAAEFIGGNEPELVFTSGTTDSLNKAAAMLAPRLDERSNVVITAMEHHSNILIWRSLARRTGCDLRVAPVDGAGALDTGAFRALVDESTKIVAFTQLSNVTGIANDCALLSGIAHERSDAVVVVDGAQGVVHLPTDVSALGCDMYAFSGHKLGAPTGIGGLWVRGPLLETLEPASFGGGTVWEVTSDRAVLSDDVERFEAGTPPIDGAVGLASAMRYWRAHDLDACRLRERRLIDRLEAGLANIEGAQVLGRAPERTGCLSFSVDVASPFDWAKLLDGLGVAVRSGHHCAQPYLEALGCAGAVRASVAPFTSKDDIDRLLEALAKASLVLKGGGVRGRARNRRGHPGRPA